MMPTPTDPPMVRLNWTRPVATARRSHSTAPWMTTSSVVDISPMPTPVTKHASIANGERAHRTELREQQRPGPAPRPPR